MARGATLRTWMLEVRVLSRVPLWTANRVRRPARIGNAMGPQGLSFEYSTVRQHGRGTRSGERRRPENGGTERLGIDTHLFRH